MVITATATFTGDTIDAEGHFTSTTITVSATYNVGPQGETGATGEKGDTGATGPAGTTTWAGITDKPAVVEWVSVPANGVDFSMFPGAVVPLSGYYKAADAHHEYTLLPGWTRWHTSRLDAML